MSHLSDVRPVQPEPTEPDDVAESESGAGRGPDRPDDPGDAADDVPRPGRLENAQAAAGDLSRMGIDPRSLGLDAPAPRPTSRIPPETSRRPGLAPTAPPVADQTTGSPTDRTTGPAGPVPSVGRRDETGAADVVSMRPGQAPSGPDVAPTTGRTPSQFETAVARTATPAAPARTDPLRMLRTVARGLATPDAAASVQQERELVEAVRRRQTERRVVAFVSGKGGVGCTAVAVGVGTTLTAMREDRSVVVDVQQGAPSLGEWLGATGTRSVTELVARREDFEAPQAPSGLAVVDGPGWDHAIGRAEVAGVLERLGVDHTFHLLDVGDDTGEAGHTALARADLVVLVGGPGPVGATAAASALDRIRYVNPQAAGRVVSVLVCTHDTTHRAAQRELAPGARGFPGLVVPPEPSLQSGDRFAPAALGAGTREAFLRVAAAVVAGGENR